MLSIKCQTHTILKGGSDSGLQEEVYVAYNSVVCILQGFPLFSTLRACRNHLARSKVYKYIAIKISQNFTNSIFINFGIGFFSKS